MLERPALSRGCRVIKIPGEGVFVSGAGENLAFVGAAYEHVVNLIDGRRTTEEIAAGLPGVVSEAEVYYCLMQFDRAGLIRDASVVLPTVHAAPPSVITRMAALASGNDADVDLVFTDDYLAPWLDQRNRSALREKKPWMLAKLADEEIWLGPLFYPGRTACWTCLAHRLRIARPIDAFLETRRNSSVVIHQPSRPSVETLAKLIESLEQAAASGSSPASAPAFGSVLAFDPSRGKLECHRISRRPQCRMCGDRELYSRQLAKLVPTDDTTSLGETVISRDGIVSPITGITAAVRKVSPVDSDLFHVYSTSPSGGGPIAGVPSLLRMLRSRNVGSGRTETEALRRALGETIERHCGAAQGDELAVRAPLADLGARALHPNLCMLFSDAQYAARSASIPTDEPMTMIPEPFDPAAQVDWTPVSSLIHERQLLLPTAFLFRGAGNALGRETCVADSNGCASGLTISDAIVRGFLELVERDAIALWWYNRRERPGIPSECLPSEYCRDLGYLYRSLGREYWVLDIESDLGIPAFAAITRRVSCAHEEIMFGFGAHFRRSLALEHAVREMNQMVVSLATVRDHTQSLPSNLATWLELATAGNQPYLRPHGDAAMVEVDAEMPESFDAGQDLARCRALLTACGLDLLVIDQSRPDIAVPVVKVMVPGLRPAAARFAPGRLFNVPVELGWHRQPVNELSLNPVSFFL